MEKVYAWLRRHPRMVDAGLALALLASGGTVLTDPTALGVAAHAGLIAISLVLAGLVVIRRQYPAAAFVIASAISAADIGTVQHEVTKLLPKATVTTASSLASEITGSASSAAKLAGELGRWLAIGVLLAAFAFASLLTLTSVSRRVTEFGTLKALGWRSRRIIAQVLGESATAGAAGAAAGVGLGFAGVAVLSAVAPKLAAKVPTSTGAIFGPVSAGPGGATGSSGPSAVHTITVPLSASVSGGAIAIAVALALLGALVAGGFAAWRIGRLRPATALTKVA